MKLQCGLCLLFSLQVAAFQAQHKSAFINGGLTGSTKLQPSTARYHGSSTRLNVSVGLDDESPNAGSKRDRLRNRIKTFLRKPEEQDEEVLADQIATMIVQAEEDVSVTMSSSEEPIATTVPMNGNMQEEQRMINAGGRQAAISIPISMGTTTNVAEVARPRVKQVCNQRKILHILGLMAATLWWYVFSSYEFLSKPDVFDIFDIYSSGNQLLYMGMSAYVTISQLCTYFFLWKLMTADSLREGQAWIGLCIFACVPADTIVILFDPTGSKSLTVLAFTLVTLIYGVILAFYLRQAAAREPLLIDDSAQEEDSAQSIINEIINYRPPVDLQNTHMAIDFARSFGAFTVTVAAIRDQLSIGEVGMAYYATLVVVILHSALEMIMTTITPGLDLCKYPSWLKFQSGMNLFQMFAATYIAHVAPEIDGDLSIFDDLVYSCLFGSAAAGFSEYVALLGEDVDFDKKISMANAGSGKLSE